MPEKAHQTKSPKPGRRAILALLTATVSAISWPHHIRRVTDDGVHVTGGFRSAAILGRAGVGAHGRRFSGGGFGARRLTAVFSGPVAG